MTPSPEILLRGIISSLLLAVVLSTPSISHNEDYEAEKEDSAAYTFTLVDVPSAAMDPSSLSPSLLGANLTLIASSKYDITRLLANPINVVKLNNRQNSHHLQVTTTITSTF